MKNFDSTELRRIRTDAGLTQWQLALSLGRTQGWLSCIELGYTTPSPKVARQIIDAIEKLSAGKT